MSDTYDEAAVQQILALARARQGQSGPLRRSQLIDVARELNISPANFLAAEEDWLVCQQEQGARLAFDQHRRQQLTKGLRRFSLGASLLLLSNLLATRQLSWSLYIALGWSIVLAARAWQTYRPSDERYNRAFRRWWLRQQIGESFKAISERLRLTADDSARNGENSNGKPSSALSDLDHQSASRSLSGRETQ